MTTTTPFGATVRPMTKTQEFSPTVIELGSDDSVLITRNGKVIGFVEILRERNNAVELLAHPVICSGFEVPSEERVFNGFATTLATEVRSLDDLASASNFIKFMNKENA